MSYIPSSRISVFDRFRLLVLGIRSKFTITATHKQTFIQTRFVTPNSCPYRQNFVCFLPSNFQPQSSLPLSHDGRSNITSFIVALVTKSTNFISGMILGISVAGQYRDGTISSFSLWLGWTGISCTGTLTCLASVGYRFWDQEKWVSIYLSRKVC